MPIIWSRRVKLWGMNLNCEMIMELFPSINDSQAKSKITILSTDVSDQSPATLNIAIKNMTNVTFDSR